MPDEAAASPTDALPRRWVLAPVAALAALAIVVDGSNHALFIALNHAAAWLNPSVWAALSLAGSVLGILALMAPTLKTRPRWLASAFLASPFALLFSEGGKRIFDIMRPAGVLEAGSFNLIGQKLYVHSLPSGHATTAFVVAASLILAWPGETSRRLAAVGIFTGATLIAFSRIAVGAHWPLDVLVGACGGWLAGALGCWLSTRLRFWQRPGGVRAMAAVVAACSLALLFVDLGYPLARLYQIGLAAWGIGGAASVLMKDPEPRS